MMRVNLNILIILLSFVFCIFADETHYVSEHIVQVTGSNFEEMKKTHPHLFVVFFAPWCGHCKRLEPDFKAACESLSQLSPPVKCASVDATVEVNLTKTSEITGFPTMKLYSEGLVSDFKGSHSKSGIVDWVIRVTGPVIQEFVSLDELKTAHKDENLFFFGIFKEKSSEKYEQYLAAARTHHGSSYRFSVVFTSDASETLAVKHKNEDEIVFSDDFTVDKIDEFVKRENVPYFGPLNGDNYGLYVHRSGLLVWFVGTKEMYESSFEVIRDVAKKFRNKYSFVWLDSAEFGPHAEQTLLITSFPGLVIQKADGTGGRYKYELNDFKSVSALESFIDDVEAGKVEKLIKSEPIPETNDEPVKVVVGKSFESMVFSEDKDVLLEIYSPWCGHCKNLEPIYKEFAEKMKDNQNLVVAKMDGDANESPVSDFEWRGYPTIFFVKAGEKKPIKYSGARTVESFVEFVESNASKVSKKHDEL